MPNASHSLMHYLRTIAGAWRDDSRDDAELLAHFADGHDEDAFRVLAWRHGAMVWRTCQRILGSTPDAEDAFQTVFLTLTRKADRLRREPLAGWLHRVARQAALNIDASARRRRDLERKIQTTVQPKAKEDGNLVEQGRVLDEELAGLPEKLRVPLVLHFLEEKTQDEVARILGCTRSSVRRCLTRGEAILRKRLVKRGVALGIGSITTLLGNATGAPAVPTGLIASTSQAAMAFRARTLTGVSAEAAEKLLRSLSMKGALEKCWWLVLAAGVCSLGSFGVGLVLWKVFVGGTDGENAPASPIVTSTPFDATSNLRLDKSRVDIYGDPLPKDAVARIGTVRFRGPGDDFDSAVNRNIRWWFNVALSPDNKVLASCHGDGMLGCKERRQSIRFWDIATGKQLHETVLKNDDDSHIAFSPGGKILAMGTDQQGVWLVDTATGQISGKPFSGGWPFAFTHDGKTLACWKIERFGPFNSLKKGSFVFYDIGTRRPIRTIKVTKVDVQNSEFLFSSFSRDGRFLAFVEETVSLEEMGKKTEAVHLMEVKTGEELATLQGQKTLALLFSPDGSNLVTASVDKIIRVWDTKPENELRKLGKMAETPALKELRKLGKMAEMPTLVDFLPDGKAVLAACAGQIRCWDIGTGKETQSILDCKGLLNPRVLSADGSKLVERVRDTLILWDVATGKEIGPAVGAPRSRMDLLTFSPDGKMLATTGRNGESDIQLWEVATGKSLGSLSGTSVSSSSVVTGINGPLAQGTWPSRSAVVEMAWPSRDILLTHSLVFGKNSKSIVIRWTKSPSGESPIEPEVYEGYKFSLDGRTLACPRDYDIEFLEIATGKKLTSISFPTSPPPLIICVFSADQKTLVTQQLNESTITLLEMPAGRKLYSFNLPEHLEADRLDKYDSLIGLSPDGRLVVTQDDKTKNVSLWEHISGRLRLRLPLPSDCIPADNNVAFSSDGRLLAMGRVSGESKVERSIHIWDLATGQECQCFQGHKAGVSCAGAPRVVFSPDGRRLASAGMDYTVLIWDVQPPPVIEKLNQPLDQKELQALKTAMVSSDAMAAYRAICKLQQVPEQAVSLAAECLRSWLPSPDSKRIVQEVSRRIEDLDSDDFQTRKKTAQELWQKLHEEESELIVENALFETLKKRPSIEVKESVTQLLNKMKEERKRKGWGGAGSPELTRMFRTVEVLERINNGLARELLVKLVEAPPRPEVQREALAALKRLGISEPAPMP